MDSWTKEKLTEHYLFKHLRGGEIEELLGFSRIVTLPGGHFLWSRQDPVRHVAVLLKGRIKIALLDYQGREYSIRYITPVDSLGDASLAGEGKHLSDAVTVEESRILFVSREGILKILNSNAHAAMALCAELSRRIDNLTREVEMQVFCRGAIRILYKLLQLKQEESTVVKITHAQLAELVGMTRERLTVSLQDLESLGCIKKKRGRIIILKPDKISEMIRDNSLCNGFPLQKQV